jgi:hypothetical protein
LTLIITYAVEDCIMNGLIKSILSFSFASIMVIDSDTQEEDDDFFVCMMQLCHQTDTRFSIRDERVGCEIRAVIHDNPRSDRDRYRRGRKGTRTHACGTVSLMKQ